MRPLHGGVLMHDTNRFPTRCYRCGEKIPAGEGLLDYPSYEQREAWPKSRGEVIVEHKECADKFQGTFVHHIYQPAGRTPT